MIRENLNTPNSWRLLLSAPDPKNHMVYFYQNPSSLESAVGVFIRQGLQRGEAVLLIATEPHYHNFKRHLKNGGFETELYDRSGQLIFADAATTLQSLLRDGEPDWKLFKDKIGGTIQRAKSAAKNSRVRIYGEMVDILAKEGKDSAALELEKMWNRLAAFQPFALFCAYFEEHLKACGTPSFSRDVCERHTHLVPSFCTV